MYLTEELRADDELELREPVGGHLTWRAEDGGPLLLIHGGWRLVPLMAMLRHRAARASTIDTRLLVSTCSPQELLCRDELVTLNAGDAPAIHPRSAATCPRMDRVRPPNRPDMFTAIGPPHIRQSIADLMTSVTGT